MTMKNNTMNTNPIDPITLCPHGNEDPPRNSHCVSSSGSVNPSRLQFRDWVMDKETGYSMLVEKWSDGKIHILDERTPSQNGENTH